MSARDDLENCFKAYGIGHVDSRVLADALTQAGWRPPARRITTVAELDALPLGSAATRNRVPYTKDHKGWQLGGSTSRYTAASLLLNHNCFLVYNPQEDDS